MVHSKANTQPGQRPVNNSLGLPGFWAQYAPQALRQEANGPIQPNEALILATQPASCVCLVPDKASVVRPVHTQFSLCGSVPMANDAKTEYERDALLKRINEMEGQISRLDDELTQSNRLATLGILAGMIAHEFNNLLTPVMSYSNLAINSPDDRELVQRAMVQTAEGTERLSNIASSILGFIRNDDQLQTCDVGTVVSETLACLVRQPEKHGIRVLQHIPPGIRAQIRPVALQQVLMNLFLNAIRSMQEGGGELRIEAGVEPAQGSNGESIGKDIVISISDSGKGISPAVMDNIFNPLTTESEWSDLSPDSQRMVKRCGNGLGLAVCRRLMEEAGCMIEARNRAGSRGATFTLHLNEGKIAA